MPNKKRDTFLKELAKKLRMRRKDLGLTLQEMADLCETSKGYIWEIEKGNTNISAWMLSRMARTLHVTLVDLLTKKTIRKEKILWCNPHETLTLMFREDDFMETKDGD